MLALATATVVNSDEGWSTTSATASEAAWWLSLNRPAAASADARASRSSTRSGTGATSGSSRDAAANQVFCFRGLPAGDYTLTVEARGYETQTSTYPVVPGRDAILPPVVMRKASR